MKKLEEKIKLYEEILTNPDKLNSVIKEDLRKIIEWVRSGIKRSNDGVDYLYEKLKERHKNIEQ